MYCLVALCSMCSTHLEWSTASCHRSGHQFPLVSSRIEWTLKTLFRTAELLRKHIMLCCDSRAFVCFGEERTNPIMASAECSSIRKAACGFNVALENSDVHVYVPFLRDTTVHVAYCMTAQCSNLQTFMALKIQTVC